MRCINMFTKTFLAAATFATGSTVCAQVIRTVRVEGPGATPPWTTATTNLHAALAASQPGDEVWIAAGTYKPAQPGGSLTLSFNIPSGVKVRGGFAGTEAAPAERAAVTANLTILSGNVNNAAPGPQQGAGSRSYMVVTAIGTGSGTLLDRVTVRDGANYSFALAETDISASGVVIADSTIELVDCSVIGNVGGRTVGSLHTNVIPLDGGGLGISDSTVTLTRCKILTNSTQTGTAGICSGGTAGTPGDGGDGAGVYARNSTLTLQECDVRGNLCGVGAPGGGCTFMSSSGAGGGQGAGLFLDNCQTTIRGSLIEDNRSGSGGSSGSFGGAVKSNGRGGSGGGVFVQNGSLQMERSRVRLNRAGHGATLTTTPPLGASPGAAGGRGGAIFATAGAAVVIANSLVEGNIGGNGGSGVTGSCPADGGSAGAGALHVDNATIALVNSTLVSNTAGTAGAGSSVFFPGCTCCALGAPGASSAAAMDATSATVSEFAGNIVWLNTGTPLTGIVSPAYSCIQGWSSGGIGVIAGDPLFVNAPLRDFRLASTSPCIDAGSNVRFQSWSTSLQDLASSARRVDRPEIADSGQGTAPIIDMGAFEVQTCAADIDHVGGLTTADIFEFLNLWFAGHADSDFDASGTTDIQDIFAFLNAWFAGC